MFKMRHLVRAGILLAIVVANLIVLRRVSTPNFLLEHDLLLSSTKVEENAAKWEARPVRYLGPSDCSGCHLDKFIEWGRSKHYMNSCENCHGPAQAHLQYGAKLTVETSPELCKGCHDKLSSRPGDFPQIDSEQHAGGWPCVNCHDPHRPEQVLQAQAGKATAPDIPHALDDQSDCLGCHASGPIGPLPDNHAGRTNGICLGCHAPLTAPAAGLESPILVALTDTFPRIPHRLEGRSDCLLCHGEDGLIQFPEDHAGRTNDMCQTCHKSK